MLQFSRLYRSSSVSEFSYSSTYEEKPLISEISFSYVLCYQWLSCCLTPPVLLQLELFSKSLSAETDTFFNRLLSIGRCIVASLLSWDVFSESYSKSEKS